MRLLLLSLCVLLADEADPDPDPKPDDAIARLDKASAKDGAAAVEKARKALVARLEKLHAGLVKAGNADKAREMKDRIALAGSIDAEKGLETKLKVSDVLNEASAKGKYRELLHVLHMPADKAGYTEFRDYGMWNGNSYGGYNGLQPGHWVYHYPRWYIWKELKP